MDDMKAIMQDELRQALARLMPPLTTAPTPAAIIPPAAVAPITANSLAVDAPTINNDNAGGKPLNTARNVPVVEMKFEDVENYMIKKAKKESLELVQDLESKQMKALTQKMSKMEELMRGQGLGYSFDFDDMMQIGEVKLPNKFKMPQLQKFDGTGDPRIHLSQYTITMSTTKAPFSMVVNCLCYPRRA